MQPDLNISYPVPLSTGDMTQQKFYFMEVTLSL